MIALHENQSSHDALRIFDRLSASELAIYIRRFGISALPRLTNHTQRVKEATGYEANKVAAAIVADEAERKKAAVAKARREWVAKNYPQFVQAPPGPKRASTQHPCLCCGELFYPLKFQISRGNGLWCGKGACRVAARVSRKKTNREAA